MFTNSVQRKKVIYTVYIKIYFKDSLASCADGAEVAEYLKRRQEKASP